LKVTSQRSLGRVSLRIAISKQMTGNNIAPFGSYWKVCPAPRLGRLASTIENMRCGCLSVTQRDAFIVSDKQKGPYRLPMNTERYPEDPGGLVA
jgi:hypothetical protein